MGRHSRSAVQIKLPECGTDGWNRRVEPRLKKQEMRNPSGMQDSMKTKRKAALESIDFKLGTPPLDQYEMVLETPVTVETLFSSACAALAISGSAISKFPESITKIATGS
jgi:hypothetical protein